jgi:hypothetical protein
MMASRRRKALGLFAASWLCASLASAAPDGELPAADGATAAAPPIAPQAPATPEPAPAPATGATLLGYHQALKARKLGTFAALSLEQLKQTLAEADAQLLDGRRDEAIATLSGLIEAERFRPVRSLDEGRAALFMLGDALGRAGAHSAARVYLLEVLAAPNLDSWSRQAIRSLVDFGLESADADVFLKDLERFAAAPVPEVSGDIAYLAGIVHEGAGRASEARAAYLRVPQNSRFWAQATYRAGLLEVDARRFKEGEQLFCRLADPKQTPKLAPLYGGRAFFETRDLARMGLGRIAHEQYRFDDARYYYHLVPADSPHLPEALYEAATSRYEAEDYETAHRLLSEARALERPHPYEDELWVLDAYVDLGRCEFPSAAKKLDQFLKRYEPVRDAARQLHQNPRGLHALLEPDTQSRGSASPGVPEEVRRFLATSVRVDPTYGTISRQLAEVEHQLGGLTRVRAEMSGIAQSLNGAAAVRPRAADPIVDTASDKRARLQEQLGATRRLLREAAATAKADPNAIASLKKELAALEERAATVAPEAEEPAEQSAGGELGGLLVLDQAQAARLEQEARALAGELQTLENALARQALVRLDERLTRLIRRARAGRIETVLGKKRAVELEVEALSQGYLPQGAVDSLEAARYLRDDEEYWPFDGEDWEDEYVGGEGLR